MKRLWNTLTNRAVKKRPARRAASFGRLLTEQLETRTLMAADALPVLMVIADQQDFYYQEYGDTRQSLETAGLEVVVAATTAVPSTPHAGSGEGSDGGIVQPDLALAEARAEDYSAVVFVGGWGSSMYQYSFEGTYSNSAYNGDQTTKAAVNDLINDFVEQDKFVTAICHGVTVLAWARVDGVSPLDGKQISVPFIGSPAVEYNGEWYGNFELGQYEQVVANGARANLVSGQYGDPNTVADDVIVDGRIITAENYDAAAYFGEVVAREVLASADAPADPEPLPPGTMAQVGNDLVIQGTENDDTIYIWSSGGGSVMAWMNGIQTGPIQISAHVRVFGGAGNDRIYATDVYAPVEIYGEAGHDQITGGHADDLLDGGDGWDRIWGGAGDDLIIGGAGNDSLHGREGNDVILGGEGDDSLFGFEGNDLLVGGSGSDQVKGEAGDDLLIGGSTSFDDDSAAVDTIFAEWTGSGDLAARTNTLMSALIADDNQRDCLLGGEGADWLLFGEFDPQYENDSADVAIR